MDSVPLPTGMTTTGPEKLAHPKYFKVILIVAVFLLNAISTASFLPQKPGNAEVEHLKTENVKADFSKAKAKDTKVVYINTNLNSFQACVKSILTWHSFITKLIEKDTSIIEDFAKVFKDLK